MLTKTPAPKKHNPQDATVRNLRASVERDARLAKRISIVNAALLEIAKRLAEIEKGVNALEDAVYGRGVGRT